MPKRRIVSVAVGPSVSSSVVMSIRRHSVRPRWRIVISCHSVSQVPGWFAARMVSGIGSGSPWRRAT